MTKHLKIKNFKLKIACLIMAISLALSLLVVINPNPALANSFSLGINPPIMQIQATPPTAIRHDFQIQNLTDNPVSLSVTLRPFTTNDANGSVSYLNENDIHLRDKNIFNKIQILENDIPISDVDLGPKEAKNLTLKIGLPKDEPPSDYYFSIVFLTKDNSTTSNGPSITGGIASNVLLSIGPKSPATGFIEKFSSPIYVTNGPIPFSVVVHNLSPYYISPQGQILIHNLFGQLIGKVDLLTQNILANSSRTLTDTKQSVKDKAMWNEVFLFGPYKATLTIALSPEGPVFHRTIYFLAMPIQYLLGIFIVLSIAIFLFYRVRKRMIKPQKD
ncbi:MAG TPA: hypothetical protein VF189_05900 [Patescibacteria group bacterium]